MDEQQLQDAIASFTRPWSERRGIETIDRNAEVALVRTPIDNLSNVLATRAIETRRDAIGSEIEILGAFALAYQLVGQSWSIVVGAYFSEYGFQQVTHPNQLAQFSRQLNQPVIRLLVSDTAGSIGYDLFENGELVEYFRGAEQSVIFELNEYEYGIQPEQYTWFPSLEEIEEDGYASDEIKQVAYFWSSCRQVAQEQTNNIWDFVTQLLLDYDAFDPALDDRYFLKGSSTLRRGDRYQVQNPGITLVIGYDQERRRREVTSVPNLVRVDYFRF